MLKQRLHVDMPHVLEVHNFKRPTFCAHCGRMLLGLIRQGLRCRECRLSYHHDCKDYVPNLCGVDQRKLSEELDNIRKEQQKTISAQDGGDCEELIEEVQSSESMNSRLPSPQDKLITPDNFRFVRTLGKGSFGKVFLSEVTGYGNLLVAVKTLLKHEVLASDDLECLRTERKVLVLGTGCPFTACLLAATQSQAHLYLAMSFHAGGDLMFHILKSKDGKFSEELSRFYAAEIIVGLQFLHSHRSVLQISSNKIEPRDTREF
ncbi:hypothetical protein Ciccas_002034 [Cichlidogyrus casuarinus]|uniref:non-specific serine/threonine protein kinase n=1 Tax=Cichlidogyrus casuarinus TaxID=1844966 RepID=A0ABD2QID0_9PLAT